MKKELIVELKQSTPYLYSLKGIYSCFQVTSNVSPSEYRAEG